MTWSIQVDAKHWHNFLFILIVKENNGKNKKGMSDTPLSIFIPTNKIKTRKIGSSK
jgi:hypothetical protein